MPQKTSISVIIPVYNGAKYLSDAIESVLRQTVQPTEIIIMDDGSTDHTRDIIRKMNIPLRYFFQENKGVASARNKGVELATENLIAFLDSDDVWVRDKLKMQVDLLQANPEKKMAIGFLIHLPTRDLNNNVKAFDEGKSTFVLSLGSTLIRRKMFDEIGFFDEKMEMSEDLDWFLRVMESKIEVLLHEDIVQVYRQHDSNSTLNVKKTQFYMLKAFKKSLDRRKERGNHSEIELPEFGNFNELIKKRFSNDF